MIEQEDMYRAILLLDAADDGLALDEERESRANKEGSRLKQITARERRKAAKEFVSEMAEKYDFGLF